MRYSGQGSHIVLEWLKSKRGVNLAFCETSVNIGGPVVFFVRIILRNRALADFACGSHGNHFNFQNNKSKPIVTFTTVLATGTRMVPYERAQNSDTDNTQFS